jgi:hypothetical protein
VCSRNANLWTERDWRSATRCAKTMTISGRRSHGAARMPNVPGESWFDSEYLSFLGTKKSSSTILGRFLAASTMAHWVLVNRRVAKIESLTATNHPVPQGQYRFPLTFSRFDGYCVARQVQAHFIPLTFSLFDGRCVALDARLYYPFDNFSIRRLMWCCIRCELVLSL